jgi:hypothetical protein
LESNFLNENMFQRKISMSTALVTWSAKDEKL